MKNIKLELSVEEVNTILDSLGERPFKQVFNLINKIQQQASVQLNPGENPPSQPNQAVQN